MSRFDKNTELMKKFNKKTEYQNFLIWLDDYFEMFTSDYCYLGFKDENWVDIFNRAIQKSIDSKNMKDAIIKYLEKGVHHYQKKEIQDNKVRIMNNYLIMISKTEKRPYIVLKKFGEFLKNNHFIITEEYFNILKKNSPIFNQILVKLDISHFNLKQVSDYMDGKYDIYLKLKPYNLSLDDTISLFSYFASLLSTPKQVLSEMKRDNQLLNKYEYVILKYSIIKQIYTLYCTSYGRVTIKSFDKSILMLELSYINQLIEKYLFYCEVQLKENKNLDFISMLHNRIKNVVEKEENQTLNMDIDRDLEKNENINSEKSAVVTNGVEKIENMTSCGVEDLTIDKGKMSQSRKHRSIYQYFLNYEGISEEKKKEIVDLLLSYLSKERQENIRKYLNGEIKHSSKEGKKATSDIEILKGQYKRYIERGIVPRSFKKERNLYQYFPNYEGTSEEKKKEVVDLLLSHLSKERQENIRKCLKGEVEYLSKEGKKATSDIEILKGQYKRYIERGVVPRSFKKERNLYQYFPNYEGISKEQKKETIDLLFSHLSKERQENIREYLKWEITSHCSDGINAMNAIGALKGQYKRYIERGIVPRSFKKERNLYQYFPNYEGISEEKKKETIDLLFSHLSKERQENIRKYLKKEITYKCGDGINANSAIEILKDQYKRYIERGIVPRSFKKERNLYQYFPNYEGISEEQKKEIIDLLLSRLSKERQENIRKYLKRELTSKCGDGINANSAIEILKDQYKRYIERGIVPRSFKKERNLYQYFPNYEGISEEQKKEIIDILFSRLSKERQENIKEYLKWNITSHCSDGIKARTDIRVLKDQYKRYMEKGKRNLYKYFPNYEEISEEQKQEIIDLLFSHLSKEKQESINMILRKEVKYSSKEGRKARNNIQTLKKQFKNYVNSIMNGESIDFVSSFIQSDDLSQISMEKKKLYAYQLKLIEYLFRKKGFTKTKYKLYRNSTIQDICRNNPGIKIEQLLSLYISISYEKINKKEETLHL